MAKREPFATSIDTDISGIFKETCDNYGLKYNTVLEAFMRQFSNHEFKLEIGKNGITLKIEEK